MLKESKKDRVNLNLWKERSTTEGLVLEYAWPRTGAPGLGQRTLYQRPIRKTASNSLRLLYPYGREDPLRKAEKGDRSVAEVAEG